MPQRLARRTSTRRAASAARWVFALMVFGAVVAVMVHYSELEELRRLLRSLDPRWLLVAAGVQTATYLCAAGKWHVALLREHRRVRLLRLVGLALVMLFTNQAFPTAGLSGGVVVVRALRRRNVPANVAMGALLVGLMTTYMGYLVAVPISLLLLRVYHLASIRLAVVVTAGFALLAIGVPSAVVWYRRSMAPRVGGRLKRVPGIGTLLDAIESTPTGLLRDRAVLTRALALQLAEMVLDASTLYVTVVALGVHTSPAAVFGSYVIASALSQLVPVPMGLGSYEGILVLMLRAVGISLEAAMTATFLFRGFTFWLPMVPGLIVARRELRAHHT